MALYPGALPAAGTANPASTLAVAGHTSLHNTGADESRALGTKLGTGSSTATSGTVLRGTGVGTSAWGQVDLTTDVTGALPLANGGTNATSAAAARTSLGVGTQAEALAAVYPVGAIYIETTGVNPATTFGFGTWTAFGAGRTLIGVGTSDAAYAAGATGGESTHLLTIPEMPAHDHDPTRRYLTPDANNGTASASGAATWSADTAEVTTSTGGGGSHNNLPPYIVTYFWKRAA
jgi:hypothetical protein